MIERGSIKYLFALIFVISLFGIILYPIYDLIIYKLITHSEFSYSIEKYIVEPLIVGFILGTVFYISDLKKLSKKRIILTYKISSGIPFKWEFEIKDKDIVTFVKSYQIKKKFNKKLCGGPIYTNYVFEGLKEGKTTITFKYVDIKDNSVVNKEVSNVIVDNKNNISIV